jgi:hypothetical protein
LGYYAENRLTSAGSKNSKNHTVNDTFVYDGDGVRVKSAVVTTTGTYRHHNDLPITRGAMPATRAANCTPRQPGSAVT